MLQLPLFVYYRTCTHIHTHVRMHTYTRTHIDYLGHLTHLHSVKALAHQLHSSAQSVQHHKYIAHITAVLYVRALGVAWGRG